MKHINLIKCKISMKCKNIIQCINLKQWSIIIIGVIAIIGIGIYNKENFFKMNFYEVLTLLFFILLTYFYAEKHSVEENSKKVIIRLLEDILSELEIYTSKLILEKKTVMLSQRTISNKLTGLSKIKLKKFNLDDLKYINKQFDEIKKYYGDNFEKKDFLSSSNSKNVFLKNVKNIESKIDDIVISLYCDI